MHMADYTFAHLPRAKDQRRVMWHVGTKDPVRPIAWDAKAVGDCLTPPEPAADTWVPDEAKL